MHKQYTALPNTPAIEVDLSLNVPAGVQCGEVEEVMRRAGGILLEEINLRAVFYPGGEVRVLTWRLTFRDPSRTLTTAEVASCGQRILEELAAIGVVRAIRGSGG